MHLSPPAPPLLPSPPPTGPDSLDTTSCLGAASCLPVGGQSVWATLGPLDPTRELVVATAGLDSTALFHDRATGGDGAVSALVALLLAADALARADAASLSRTVLFALFQVGVRRRRHTRVLCAEQPPT